MKGLNIDFKKIAVSTAGTAVGLVAVTQVNKIGFIKNIQKPLIKGLVMVGLGQVLLPMLASKLVGKGKSGAGDFVTGASNAITTYGVGHMLSNMEATKSLVPEIKGYEDNAYLGAAYEDDGNYNESVQGYEDAPVTEHTDVY